MNEENGSVVLFCNTDEEKEKGDQITNPGFQITNPGFHLPSLRSAWDLVYLVQNRDFREILRNLIGRLEDWEPVSYTHLRAHETRGNLVCRLLLEKKNFNIDKYQLIISKI